jgi:hypothetical protein
MTNAHGVPCERWLRSLLNRIEDFPDASPQGRSLAIPAEHVRCVLEVKASFSPKSVGDAIEHLADLPDEPQEKYKLHLPPTFCCGLIFFELRQEHQFSEAAMNRIVSAIQLRGFFGGIILRGEGHTKEVTGKLSLFRSETPIESIIGKTKASLLSFYGRGESIKIADNLHFGSMLRWGEPNFSQFGFDVIAMMQGTYEVGRLSSFHGMGISE